MTVCLMVLVGLPGSGKTWLARQLSASLCSKYSFAHVEYDAVISLQHQAKLQAARAEGSDTDAWRSLRRTVEVAIENAIVSSESAVSGDNKSREYVENGLPAASDAAEVASNCNDELAALPDGLSLNVLRDILSSLSHTTVDLPRVVIIDDNMYLGSMRYRLYQLARRRRLGFCQVFLDTPDHLCLRRNSERAEPLPAEVITGMASRLEPPDPCARLWEAATVVVSPDSYSLSYVGDLIAAALASPAEPVVDNSLEAERARLVCSTSQVHQVDVVTRRLVGQHAAAAAGHRQRADRARAANAARQALLGRVRSGLLGLDVEPSDEERFAATVAALFKAQLNYCCNSDR